MESKTPKYWVYLNNTVQGPFHPMRLPSLPGFKKNTLICPEYALGQWKEAEEEPSLKIRSVSDWAQSANEEYGSQRILLERAIENNYGLDEELKTLKIKHAEEIQSLTKQLQEKEARLMETLEKSGKRTSENIPEHPLWETLYKTLKNRLEGKIKHLSEQLGARDMEIMRLRRQAQEECESRIGMEKEFSGKLNSETRKAGAETEKLKTILEQKSAEIKELKNNLAKSSEAISQMHDIMQKEKEASERLLQTAHEEKGASKNSLEWKEKELSLAKEENSRLSERYKKAILLINLKTQEQEGMARILASKMAMLQDHLEAFGEIEGKMKTAFEKILNKLRGSLKETPHASQTAETETETSLSELIDDVTAINSESSMLSGGISAISEEITREQENPPPPPYPEKP